MSGFLIELSQQRVHVYMVLPVHLPVASYFLVVLSK